MREILFRGKLVDDGKWIFGSFCMDALEQYNGLCGVDGFIRLYDKEKRKMQSYEVERDTVGQFTGLLDKNGKRIFEGDILKRHYDFLFPDDVTFDLVVFCDSAWCIQQNGFEPEPLSADIISELSEVVGNIHDNPELLEDNRS